MIQTVLDVGKHYSEENHTSMAPLFLIRLLGSVLFLQVNHQRSGLIDRRGKNLDNIHRNYLE